MIRINQLKLQIPHTEEALEKKIQKTLHLKKGDSFTYRIHRQSLDARRKPELFYVYTVDVTVDVYKRQDRRSFYFYDTGADR